MSIPWALVTRNATDSASTSFWHPDVHEQDVRDQVHARLDVTTGGTGVVAHAGSVAVRLLAERRPARLKL